MAFFSTSAAAGVVADPAAAAASERNDNTPHYHFIHSMILPSTLKIQKELRGRRFRVRVVVVGPTQARLGHSHHLSVRPLVFLLRGLLFFFVQPKGDSFPSNPLFVTSASTD
jgi:hypothetical protein